MTTGCDSFGTRNFGSLNLGDVRRTRRLVALVDQLCRHPGGTLPDKLNEPADLRAFYRLMNRREVTHDVVLRSHAACTRRQIAAVPGRVVLLLHDATELDYTTHTSVRDQLGQIGEGSHRGYICHNSLAVRADTGAVLGLTSQILHHRADVPKDETIKQKRERESRESRLWVRAAQASGAAPAGVRCVDVSDSLSDTFEYLAHEVTHGRHFVLRARENRGLDEPVAGQHYLFEAVRAQPAVAERSLVVQPSSGRRGRTTTVRIAWTPVRLAVPGKHHGKYPKKPLDLWAVRVWEPDTPADEEPLEWLLLTNVAVTTAADALERMDWYERRPIVEEYHKGLKTGCRIETMQFDTLARLEPAIAVVSVVTTTLLQLRDAARAPEAEQRLATEVIDPLYVQVLHAHYGRRLGAQPTVRQFYLHVARLGGHQNRKVDGFPGWITLWRGWTKLNAMVDGWQAAHRKH
jgi:Transposase DNA-binding